MAATLILAVQIYLAVGLVVAIAFLGYGIDRVDENARGVWIFRPLLIPGIAILWPLVLLRWIALVRGNVEGQGRYRPPLALQPALALLLAVIVPIMIAGALVIRQDGPNEARAEMLEPPR
ncbi:hypothetical protein V8J82_01400 [Gymnodinialimonas sp. 2305UL16-5]|uniref:hypothetical protein n=1 Tax=Gymnodinialimonas mytili TaxID=3126503 RepID=UPI0030B0ABBA